MLSKLFKKKDNDIYKRFENIYNLLQQYNVFSTNKIKNIKNSKYQIETDQGRVYIEFNDCIPNDYIKFHYKVDDNKIFSLSIHKKDDSKLDIWTNGKIGNKEVFDAIYELETIIYEDKVNLNKAKESKEKLVELLKYQIYRPMCL